MQAVKRCAGALRRGVRRAISAAKKHMLCNGRCFITKDFTPFANRLYNVVALRLLLVCSNAVLGALNGATRHETRRCGVCLWQGGAGGKIGRVWAWVCYPLSPLKEKGYYVGYKTTGCNIITEC